MSSTSSSRKRRYRQYRIKCDECESEMNTDYRDIHAKNVHNGKKIKFSPVVEPSQIQLHSFFTRTGASANIGQPLATTTGSFTRGSDVSENTVEDDSIRKSIDIQSHPSLIDEPVTGIELTDESKISNVNVDQDQTGEPYVLVTPTDDEIDELRILNQKTVHVPPAGTSMVLDNPDTDNSKFERHESDITERPPMLNIDILSTATPTVTSSGPNQPIQSKYPTRTFGNETFTRKFNTEWYKKYPWISYETKEDQCVCFPCREFEKDDSFVFTNWKKPEKLSKHGKSQKHITSMTKWALSKANHRMNTSVLKQMDSAHKQYVHSNRHYLQVIIECLMFNVQQNVAIRGHVEDRKQIWEVSDINRGNFLEMLRFRCKDLPWLKMKLQTHHKQHIQWTSPKIQNELIEIVSSLVLQRITRDVKSSGNYSVIVDETSDISRSEQVSLCLRYVVEGETRETFSGFYATESTEGEILYELVKKSITNLNLLLSDIVGKCFDGAANMNGCNKGVASRMKECSPLALYVHCYAHRLNLALQDTMTSIEPIRHALGIIQSLYNFIEASPKRHSIFQNIQVEEEHSDVTLKSMSVTRWSCRWQAVKAVFEQLPRIIRALLSLSSDHDARTYTDSNNLLNAICDFKFVFGLVVLRVILSNTDGLSKYLQGKNVDVIAAKKTAEATIEALTKCRNEESFQMAWSRAKILSQMIEKEIDGTQFSFKDATAPRFRQPSRRIQALIGEQFRGGLSSQPSAESHYRVTTFYATFDKVLLEMKSRFQSHDQEILCALAEVVSKTNISPESLALVSSFYGLDMEILAAEKEIFQNFLQKNPAEIKHAPSVIKFMFQNGLHEVLPVFYKVCSILTTIPATSCSAERSFSDLRRIKTYLRSTMRQDRLSSLALICIERAYANRTLENDMENIIDIFGKRKKRNAYFF